MLFIHARIVRGGTGPISCALWLGLALALAACKEKVKCPPGQMEYSGHCLITSPQSSAGFGGSGDADAAVDFRDSEADRGVDGGASEGGAAAVGGGGAGGMSVGEAAGESAAAGAGGAGGTGGMAGEPASGDVPPGCFATLEFCDSKDNDCDGNVDEELTRPCGPPSRGQCKSGTETCANGTWSACTGAVEPVPEVCDAERNDENCDGAGNEGCACSAGEQKVCPPSEGICVPGQQYCIEGTWGSCEGASAMTMELCDAAERDEDCDGMINEGCECTEAQTDRCDTGRPGACMAGIKMCAGGVWGECIGTAAPGVEVCDEGGVDEDCDGTVNEDCCDEGAEKDCTTEQQGLCRAGKQRCAQGAWGACESDVEPQPERCDGQDNDCNGMTDDGEPCPNGQRCVERRCVGCTRATEATDCESDDPCQRGRCVNGACDRQPSPDGTSCETEDGAGMCMRGECMPEMQASEDDVVCRVHAADGSARSEPTTGITFLPGPVGLQACLADRAAAACAEWFGECETRTSRVAITWELYAEGHTDVLQARSIAHGDAMQAFGSLDQLEPRKWFGRPRTADGRAVECRLFDDPARPMSGTYREFFVNGPGMVCATQNTCASAFGLCEVVE